MPLLIKKSRDTVARNKGSMRKGKEDHKSSKRKGENGKASVSAEGTCLVRVEWRDAGKRSKGGSKAKTCGRQENISLTLSGCHENLWYPTAIHTLGTPQ